MTGAGHTVIANGAVLALSDGATKFLNGARVIDNSGTITLAGNHTVQIDTGGATLNNLTGGLFSFSDNSTFSNNLGAIVTVNQTTPARICDVMLNIFDPLSVHTPADNP